MASYQKGRVEKILQYIRSVVPKGISFNNHSQNDITLMMNHITSAAGDSLNKKTFKIAEMLLDNSLLDKLSLKLAHNVLSTTTCSFLLLGHKAHPVYETANLNSFFFPFPFSLSLPCIYN